MKWVLVLSGGGAKGLTYIGLIKLFEELNIPKPSLIVGCSIGAVIGAMYAIGKSSKDMEKVFDDDFDQNDYLGTGKVLNIKVIDKAISAGAVLSNLINSNALDDGQKIYALFRRITDNKNFNETDIPFVCNAVDLHSGDELILKEGELAKSMLASCSYPLILKPVRIKNRLLVDGGMGHNSPVWIAHKFGIKEIVSVSLSHFYKTKFPQNYTDIPSVFIRLMSCIFQKQELRKEDYPSFWIDLSNDIDSSDFYNSKDKINLGYTLALKQKDDICKFFAKGIEGSTFRKSIKSQMKGKYRV